MFAGDIDGGDSGSFSLDFEEDLLQELNTLPGLNEYSDITLDLLEDPVMMIHPNLKEEPDKDSFLNIFSPKSKEQRVRPDTPPPPLAQRVRPPLNKIIQLQTVGNRKVFRLERATKLSTVKQSPVSKLTTAKLNTAKLNTTKLNTSKLNVTKLNGGYQSSNPELRASEPLIKTEPSAHLPSKQEDHGGNSDGESDHSEASLDLSAQRKRASDTSSAEVKRARSDVLNLCRRKDSSSQQDQSKAPIIVTIKKEGDEYTNQYCSDLTYQNFSLKEPERHRRGGRTTVQVPSHLKTECEIKSWKREQRMLKNRESACLSRRRKKEYLESVERRLAMSSDQNLQLMKENEVLRKKNRTLHNENGLLRNALDRLNTVLGTSSTKSKEASYTREHYSSTKGTVLMILFLFLFGISIGPISFFNKTNAMPRQAQSRGGYGRSLLSVDRQYNEYMMDYSNIDTFTNYLKGRLQSEVQLNFTAQPDKQYIVSSQNIYVPSSTADLSRVSVILPRHDQDGSLVEMVCDVVEANNITSNAV